METSNKMISIDEYVSRYSTSRPTDVADMLLRGLPEAIALWRNEQHYAPLEKNLIMVDDETGIVTIADNGKTNATSVSEADDVKAYSEIANEMLQLMPHTINRMARHIHDCRSGKYATMGDVMLAVEKRRSSNLYIIIIAVIAILLALLAYLNQSMQ